MTYKFVIGDKVRVIPPTHDTNKLFKSADPFFEENDWIEDMDAYVGKVFEITEVETYGYILKDAETNEPVLWNWLPEWLQPVQEQPVNIVVKTIPESPIEYLERKKAARYDNLYMDIAKRVAQMSHARRSKVGAVLVKDGRILSMGWNGMPSGFDNNCEDVVNMARVTEDFEIKIDNLVTKREVLHAELNCLAKVAGSHESAKDGTMYVTLLPCVECAKLILQSGIKEIVYAETYRDISSIAFLQKGGIIVRMLQRGVE